MAPDFVCGVISVAVGAIAVLGAASGAASALGHTLEKKEGAAAVAAPSAAEKLLEMRLALEGELADLRMSGRSKEVDARKAEIKQQLKRLQHS